MEVATVWGCRRDFTTTVSREVISCKWVYHTGMPANFQHKTPRADVTHLSPSLLLLAGLQRPFLTVCSSGQMQACQVYSLLLDPYRVHPLHSLLPSGEQQLWGPPLFYISLFVNDAPPRWLGGDETPSVSLSPPLMGTTSDVGSCFEEQGMDNRFQQT